MNLMEKYQRKFEAGEKAVILENQIIAPVIPDALPEDLKDAFEERTAIMDHDGGIPKDQADKFTWCREVCILTPSQRELCERVKPCPKET